MHPDFWWILFYLLILRLVTLLCFVSLWILWFVCVCMCVHVCVHGLSRVWLWDSMECSLLGSSVHGTFQTRILELIAISFPGWLSWPSDQIPVSLASPTLAGRFFTSWATREVPYDLWISSFFSLENFFFILGKELFQILFCFVFNQEIRRNKSPEPL